VITGDATVPVEMSDLAAFAARFGPDVTVVVDPAGAIRFASDSVERVLGFAPDDHLGDPIWDFVHPDDMVAAAGAVSEASRTEGYHQPAVFRIRRGDGAWVECEVNGITVEDRGGAWLVLAIRPTGDRNEVIGRRRRLEQLIRMASLECSAVPWDHVDVLVERYLQDLADVVGAELVELAWQDSDEDLQIGARWPIVRGASVATPVSGCFVPAWPLEQTGATLLQFTRDLHGLPDSPVKDRLLALRSEALVEVPLSRRSPWAVIRLAFGPQWRRWDDTNVDLVVVLASTLMATLRRCVAEAHLHEQARTDPLTGLMNRAELYRQFAAALSRRDQLALHATPGRAGDDGQLGVLYCDLDYFKQVNDRFGHTAGDELLVRVAEVLRLHTRDGDLIARVGGDEFILVCPDLDSPETLSTIMARLCHAVSSLAPSGVPLRLSIGAAMARTGLGVDDLIRLADEAMYRAKRDGRRYGAPLVTDGTTSA
jgi:diguanylate cyclase (GGDEF)-like protein/PAS domain S-box-containing protein